MSNKKNNSNPVLDSALSHKFPEYSLEKGMDRVVAFGDKSHKCPIYVRQVPPCTEGCPAGNDIRGWLMTVQHTSLKKRTPEESYEMAWHIASRTSPFPAVCGRVCPYPCETRCNRNEKEDGPVNINAFERWIGDYGIEHRLEHKKLTDKVMNKKIAVIGSGPAGLSCAFQLARRGYPVTVFDAFPEPGGMLRYGIPSYRLPRKILDAEIDAIVRTGVEIRCNTVIGREISLDDLNHEFDTVFIGMGAHKGIELGLEGEDAENVYSGAGFLNLVHSGKPVSIGNKVIIIGGGDSAISAARVARRLGADVTIVYRRTRDDMPAIDQEINDAIDEKINFIFQTAPKKIRIENGKAVALQCVRMKQGQLDKSGRPVPVPIEGSEFDLTCTTLIPAVGQVPEWRDLSKYITGKDWLKPDRHWAIDEGIYAGGDALKLGLVVTAIGHGMKAAEEIDARLSGKNPARPLFTDIVTPDKMHLEFYAGNKRNERGWVPTEKRSTEGLELEADLGITEEQFRSEARRCMSCGLCYECNQCLIYCPQIAISKYPDNPVGEVMYSDYNKCVGCHICSEVCPCGYIRMGMAEGL